MTSASKRSISFASSRASRLLSSIPAATASPCPPSTRPSAWTTAPSSVTSARPAPERAEPPSGRQVAHDHRVAHDRADERFVFGREAQRVRQARRQSLVGERGRQRATGAGDEARRVQRYDARRALSSRAPGPRAARLRVLTSRTTTSSRRPPRSPGEACVSSGGASTRSAIRPAMHASRVPTRALVPAPTSFEPRVHLFERAVPRAASSRARSCSLRARSLASGCAP